MPRIAGRRKSQPAPPRIIFDALTHWDAPTNRPWLTLHDGEIMPMVLESTSPGAVVWSSLWREFPDARITFAITDDDAGYGSIVSWEIAVPSAPADVDLEPLRYRISQLINRDLRASFDQ